MSETPSTIGIDFGGTSVKTGVVRGNTILDLAPPIATQDFESPQEIIATLVRTIEDLRAHHPDVMAVGIGMPGFVDFDSGTVLDLTNVRGWKNIGLKKAIQSKINLPTAVDNDANCMAYAEWKVGAGMGLKHLVCATLGTGVGGGVIANGQMIRGANFGAGEIGQSSIDYQGREGHYGNIGALEDYIGNRELAQSAFEAYRSAGQNKQLEDCSPAALAKAAHGGDPIAIAVWNQTGQMLATAMMNACWFLNPEAIIIGGGVARAGELLFAPLKMHLLKQLSAPFKDNLAILPAAFGHEAGLIGAASLALDEAAAL